MRRTQSFPRFIPTHVGNTRIASTQFTTFPVHPHARGEHVSAGKKAFPTTGSSPRTWGTLQGLTLVFGNLRFIPTHVGNTARAHACLRESPVHPHARGEHISESQWKSRQAGSSPRTWGTQSLAERFVNVERFIPTHVGNTAAARACRREPPVHPHARGEHAPTLALSFAISGSSPRTWGTHYQLDLIAALSRFIPTHVGNTAMSGISEMFMAVHPHARGEHPA